MNGEFDSPSKPATDAYREGYERVFGRKFRRSDMEKHIAEYEQQFLEPAGLKLREFYPNGCPILESNEAH